ncbi:hypothetical protein LPJ56_007038 [Coemansia sp. RSA 2599]|nr:hypothetical protein LPJ75_007109 [Coemansia sp. RSA 2598]KAJ1803111.1 hypothetical protein LPJ56_007038 [Coemansia sp. RSA 2599]
MSWRVCHVHNSQPDYCHLQVPIHPGEYTYYLQKRQECCCSGCTTSDTRYRTYYELLMKSPYLSNYSCKEIYDAYKNASGEEKKELEKKWNMTMDQYKDYLTRHGYSTENLLKTEKPKIPHCVYQHDDDGNHPFYHYSHFAHPGYGHHHGHHHGCWHH